GGYFDTVEAQRRRAAIVARDALDGRHGGRKRLISLQVGNPDGRIAVALRAASRDVLDDSARRSAVPASADLREVRSRVEHAGLPDGMHSAVNAAIDARGRDFRERTAETDHLAATTARARAMESNFPLIAHGFLRVVHVGLVQVNDLGTALVPAKLSAGERESYCEVLRGENCAVQEFLRLVVELIVAREPLALEL